MAAQQTKMIIITSDEDLIRQISLRKAANTRIVDLDHPNDALTTDDDELNMMSLALLAELSTLNSKSDQVCKRVLDAPQYPAEAKPAKHLKKASDLLCAICGDRAIGFNYDVLSCASCKAFFRRNANQSQEKVRCLTGTGQCSVAHETRRKCPRCRLDRCLSVGMRKDFILSDEEKQRRRERLEENRTATLLQTTAEESVPAIPDDIDRLLTDLDQQGVDLADVDPNDIEHALFGSLAIEDWITIENIRTAFISMFQSAAQCPPSMDLTNQASALLSWSQNAQRVAGLFVDFFRQIDEFESLSDDDRLLLIKCNLLCVFPIFKCFIHKASTDGMSLKQQEVEEMYRQFYTLCGDSTGVLQILNDVKMQLVQVTEQDPAVLALLMPILLFTRGQPMEEGQAALADVLAVSRAQSHYIQLLWNYLVNRIGEPQTCKYFTALLSITFRIQVVSKVVREFFRTQFVTSNTANQIGPLMQTVLNIS